MSHSIKSPILVDDEHNRFCLFFTGFHDRKQVSSFQVLIIWFCMYDTEAIYNVELYSPTQDTRHINSQKMGTRTPGVNNFLIIHTYPVATQIFVRAFIKNIIH